jgi:hypothetical protein
VIKSEPTRAISGFDKRSERNFLPFFAIGEMNVDAVVAH